MRKTKIMIFIFGAIDIVASLVFAIAWIVALTHRVFEEMYFASVFICLTSGLVFLYIGQLGNRVESLEDEMYSTKKKVFPSIRKDFSVHDKVELVNDVECEQSIIHAGEAGIVSGKLGDEYLVKFPNLDNKTCKVNQKDIKHLD